MRLIVLFALPLFSFSYGAFAALAEKPAGDEELLLKEELRRESLYYIKSLKELISDLKEYSGKTIFKEFKLEEENPAASHLSRLAKEGDAKEFKAQLRTYIFNSPPKKIISILASDSDQGRGLLQAMEVLIQTKASARSELSIDELLKINNSLKLILKTIEIKFRRKESRGAEKDRAFALSAGLINAAAGAAGAHMAAEGFFIPEAAAFLAFGLIFDSIWFSTAVYKRMIRKEILLSVKRISECRGLFEKKEGSSL